MAISTGTKSIAHSMTHQWVNIGQQPTPATAKASVSWSFNRLQQINSNADKNGLRATVLGIAIVRVANVSLGADATNEDRYSAQVQREGMFSFNIVQPNIDTKLIKQTQNLAFMGMTGRMINPAFQAYVDDLPPKQGITQDVLSVTKPSNYPFAGGDPTVAFDRFSSLNQFESWNDNYNFVQVSSTDGASAKFVDATMIPLCQYSGSSAGASWESKDCLPFPAFTNSNTPWTVTVGCLQDKAGSFNNPTFVSDNMDCWVLIRYVKKTDEIRIGMLPSIINTPIGDGNYNPLPYLYRVIASVPDFGATTKSHGITVPYAPEDWYTFASTSQLRLNDNGVQCFPLDSFSEAEVTITHFNVGSYRGGNPKARFDYNGFVTSTTLTLDNFSAGIVGVASSIPCFPFAVNHLFMSGFPPAFMSTPNLSSSRLNITYTGTLNAAQKSNVISIHVNEFYDKDMPKLLAYALFGDSNMPANVQLPSIVPMVDAATSKTDLVRMIVPCKANPL